MPAQQPPTNRAIPPTASHLPSMTHPPRAAAPDRTERSPSITDRGRGWWDTSVVVSRLQRRPEVRGDRPAFGWQVVLPSPGDRERIAAGPGQHPGADLVVAEVVAGPPDQSRSTAPPPGGRTASDHPGHRGGCAANRAEAALDLADVVEQRRRQDLAGRFGTERGVHAASDGDRMAAVRRAHPSPEARLTGRHVAHRPGIVRRRGAAGPERSEEPADQVAEMAPVHSGVIHAEARGRDGLEPRLGDLLPTALAQPVLALVELGQGALHLVELLVELVEQRHVLAELGGDLP